MKKSIYEHRKYIDHISNNGTITGNRITAIDWEINYNKIMQLSKTPKTTSFILSDEIKSNNINYDFWILIKKNIWYDSDEMYMDESNIKFNKRECIFVDNYINKNLLDIFEKKLTNVLYELDQYNKKNMIYHIIMKGKEYYDVIMETPELGCYLLDKYYPAYEWIANICQL